MTRFATLAAILLAAAPQAWAAAPTPSTRTLSIGVFPALRPLELVRQERWLEQLGYDVSWHDFLAGIPPEAAAMAAGSIDFGEADTSGIEQVAARSPGIMWYIANGAANYVALIAGKDTGINSVADLKGRKVGGVAPNTAPTAVLQMALAQAGMKLSDVNGYNMVGPTHPAALERGAIDAAISYVPHSADAVVNGGAKVIVTADQVYGGRWLGGGIIVRPAFAKEHPDVVVDLLRQVRRAETMIREQPKEAYAALAAVSHVSVPTVTYAFEHGLVAPVEITPDKAAMIKQTEVLQKFGVVNVPDMTAYIDALVHPEFAEQALKP